MSFVKKKSELNGPTWLGMKDSWFERRCLIGQVISTQIMTDFSKCRCWDSIQGRPRGKKGNKVKMTMKNRKRNRSMKKNRHYRNFSSKYHWCRICGGILGFYSVRQIFFRSDSFSKMPDRMSDKLSWIFDMSVMWLWAMCCMLLVLCYVFWVMDYVFWVVCYRLWVMSYLLWVVCYGLCGMNCVLLVLCYELYVMVYELCVMGYVLLVLCYKLCVMGCVMCYV